MEFYEYPERESILTKLKSISLKTSQNEMIERMMFVQALETVRCPEENVVTSVADANIGSLFGWGFAPFKGGTFSISMTMELNLLLKRRFNQKTIRRSF